MVATKAKPEKKTEGISRPGEEPTCQVAKMYSPVKITKLIPNVTIRFLSIIFLS